MRTLVNPPLTDDLLDRLEEIWVAVTEHGGAVGFTPPIDPAELSTAVAGYWDRVIDGEIDLVVAVDRDGTAHGFAFLVHSAGAAVARHRAEVHKLMRDPGLAGKGIGAEVLQRLEEQARDRGVTLLTLTVRDRTGRERFYEHHGYRLVARLPGWLRIDGRPRDELLMAKDLTAPADPSTQSEHVRDGAIHHPEPEHVRTGSGPTGALTLPVKRLDPDLPLPTYARAGDAGMDLLAREDKVLPAGTRCVMPTGVAVAIPEGHVGLIHPRSGLAVREGLSIVNTPGTIDAGYRGEIKVPLVNLDPSATIRIKRGERIAQMLIQQVEQAELVEVEELPHGIRGEQGFGSTGR